ncbi:hypothetical protein [Vibrio sp. SCSIO 43137]|uniref:hypothetical protein n=1 Tax=Vibrio sp. SCSIO 43137 TaxID=3021011 RepID=UPI002306FFBE|nr:hypothetical protein [Vibrio sp. SCSIO 43137]WCE28435.1 hypothetical protein PK654_08605 [Vibrio sp. SCSIO 43137]
MRYLMSFNPQKARDWNGKSLKGEYLFTIKMDGIRLTRNEDGIIVSRRNKPLRNLPVIPEHIQDAEFFRKDLGTSQGITSTHDTVATSMDDIYELSPNVDPRMKLFTANNPSANFIQTTLERVMADGHEGLVLRRLKDGVWIKVKGEQTYDVKVTGMKEGNGKHAGKLGSLLTAYGSVGTGFSDEEREEFMKLHAEGKLVGTLIEVECMDITAKGKFRHARFKCVRTDKDEESPPEPKA